MTNNTTNKNNNKAAASSITCTTTPVPLTVTFPASDTNTNTETITTTTTPVPVPVPSTIYTTTTTVSVLHRKTKETCTYTYEKEEEVTIMSTNSTTKMTEEENDASFSSSKQPQDQDCHSTSSSPQQPQQQQESPPQESPEEEPYQELKWNTAPLFLNDKFDNPNELLMNEKKTLPIHAGRTALLVVDVQPEYWSQCPAVRQDFPHFPDRLYELVEQCRRQKAKIIWVRADYRYAHSPWLVQFARLHQGRIPSEVYSDPSGKDGPVEWEDFATPQGGEYVIPKTSWSSTRHTALMDLLKQSGIDTVLVCGLITSVCVQHSAFGIFEAGYRTLLVTDACADRGKARHDAALALYGDYMYELATVQDLCTPHNPFYLQPAQPVWLTPSSIDNLVQPQFFNALQDSVVTNTYMYNKEDNHHAWYGDDSRTTTVSNTNKQEHPTFYKVETIPTSTTSLTDELGTSQDHAKQQQDTVEEDGVVVMTADKSMMNATARTSTSSLSTLSTPSPLLHSSDSPITTTMVTGSNSDGSAAPLAPPTTIQV